MQNNIKSFDWFGSRAERECTLTKLVRFSAQKDKTKDNLSFKTISLSYDRDVIQGYGLEGITIEYNKMKLAYQKLDEADLWVVR